MYVGTDKIDFMFNQEQDTKVITGKTYSWIKCNQNFQGFYTTEYTFATRTWTRFSSVLEAQPTVNTLNLMNNNATL
jgi:hypothetical protein